MLIWCLVLFMQDDGGLSLQISTERLLFLLGWHNIELHGNAWRVENVEERHQKASSNTKPGSNKWNDTQLQTLCGVKCIKYKLLFHKVSQYLPRRFLRGYYLLSIESMFIEAFNASSPEKIDLFGTQIFHPWRPFNGQNGSKATTSKRLQRFSPLREASEVWRHGAGTAPDCAVAATWHPKSRGVEVDVLRWRSWATEPLNVLQMGLIWFDQMMWCLPVWPTVSNIAPQGVAAESIHKCVIPGNFH